MTRRHEPSLIEDWKRFGQKKRLYQLYGIETHKDDAEDIAKRWKKISSESLARIETVNHLGHPVYLVWVRDGSTDRIYKDYRKKRSAKQ